MKFLFSSWFHLKNERLVLIRLAEIVLFSYLDLKLLRRQTERCAQMDIRCTTAPSGIKKKDWSFGIVEPCIWKTHLVHEIRSK